MVKVEINGQVVEFDQMPTEADIDEAARQLKPVSEKIPFPVAKPAIAALNSIPEAFKSGISQAKTGFDMQQNATNPIDLIRGGGKTAAGILNTASAPLAPFFAPIGQAINKVADKVSDIPSVQKFAASKAGQVTSDIADTAVDFSTVIGGLAGLKGGAQSKIQLPAPTKAPATAPFQVSTKSLKTNPLKGTLPTPESVAAKGTEKILSPRGIQKKVQEATAKNVDLKTHISDPDVYAGIKVENYKINPDQAISTVDNRIGILLDAKREMLPTLDKFVPKISRDVVKKRAIESVKGKYSPLDELDVINSISHQVDALPAEMSLTELDNFRARFRQSARDAKGMQKRASEYAALENATRDTVFDATDNLPFAQKGDFAAVNKYVKDMIETKTFLDKTLRGQIVPGGRLGQMAARGVGAVVGSSHGPFATLLGAEVGGMVQNIIANNALGSSVKFQLIKGITKDPAILAQAEKMLSAVKDYSPPMLPAPKPGAPRTTEYNYNPIPMTADSTKLDQGAVDARYGQSLNPNISRQNTANKIIPSAPNPSMMPSILPQKSDAAPRSTIPTVPIASKKRAGLPKQTATGAKPSPTTASKPSKAANTSTGNAPTERGGVSAQKADTSGGFDGDYLYHSTPSENLPSIASSGLKKGNGQFGEGIYLAGDEKTLESFVRDFDSQIRIKKDAINPSKIQTNQTQYRNSQELLLKDIDVVPPSAIEVKVGNKWLPLSDVDASTFIRQSNPYTARGLKEWWQKNESGLSKDDNDFIARVMYSNDATSPVSQLPVTKLILKPAEKTRLDRITQQSLYSPPSIPKDLEPLAAEARKYKSAEEFVRAAKTLPVTKWGVSEEVLSSVLFKDIKPGDGTAGVENVLTDLWHKANGK